MTRLFPIGLGYTPRISKEADMSYKLICVVFVLLMFSPVFGQEYVQVFVTSTGPSAGARGSLDGMDDYCLDRAMEAGLDGFWVAWASDSTNDAADRILDAEYRLLDGTVVANDLADLTDGSLDHPINRNENNQVVTQDFNFPVVWTGTLTDGTRSNVDTCDDWSDGGASGVKGDLTSTTSTWTEDGTEGCDALARLYCFSAALVPVELEEFSVE